MLTKCGLSAYADGMEPTLQIVEGAASNDPDIGLRAVAALRALAERLELIQVRRAFSWAWTTTWRAVSLKRSNIIASRSDGRTCGARSAW